MNSFIYNFCFVRYTAIRDISSEVLTGKDILNVLQQLFQQEVVLQSNDFKGMNTIRDHTF